MRSNAIRCSSCRTGRTSTASSGSSSSAGPLCSRARSARSTTSSSGSRTRVRTRVRSRRTHSAACSSAARLPTLRSTGSPRPRASAGSPTRSYRRSASSSPACSIRRSSKATSQRSTRRIALRSTGSVSGIEDSSAPTPRNGAAERIGIVCPSVERLRAPLETALGTLGVPYSIDGELRLAQTPFGQSLTAMLRFAWLGGTRRDLFTFLRSPFSGVERRAVDFLEGRLRGRAIQNPERVVEESEKLRGSPLPALADLRDAEEPVAAVRRLAARMLRAAYGLDGPPVGEASRIALRAYETVTRLLNELDRWQALGEELTREETVGALERQTLRPTRGDETGRVAVVDLLRARTRRFDIVFVLGLEEGSLPRRGSSSPFLDDDTRRALDENGARLQRPDSVSRDRYLFYTACTRRLERLYLVREAATDDGSPREPSPFWDEVQSVFEPEDVRRWTRRRPLSALTWTLDDAPTERERLRALAELAARDRTGADALAQANGWERRLQLAVQ